MTRKIPLSARIDLAREGARTFAELAKRVGVSERTLRRWRNQGVQPSPQKAAAVSAISRASTSVRRRKLSQSRREGLDLSKVAAPPAARRITRIDPMDPQRKARILSDTVELTKTRTTRTSWGEILSRYRDEQNRRGERAAFRGLVVMHGSFESEGARRQGGPTMTEWEEINDWEDEEIEDWIEQADEDGDIIGLRILRANAKTTRAGFTHQSNRQKTSATLGARARSKRKGKKAVRKK